MVSLLLPDSRVASIGEKALSAHECQSTCDLLDPQLLVFSNMSCAYDYLPKALIRSPVFGFALSQYLVCLIVPASPTEVQFSNVP